MVFVGNDENPSVNVSLSFYQPPKPYIDDGNSTIIYQNATQYINKTTPFWNPSKPQVSSIVLIIIIVFGSIAIIGIDCLKDKKKSNKVKSVDLSDPNFSISDRMEDVTSNRNLFRQSMDNQFESNATN
jgi:hypothetical protein